MVIRIAERKMEQQRKRGGDRLTLLLSLAAFAGIADLF